ncbi:MAG TPA: DUF5709 domain-containing protein [Pseudonocardiaceae bacterium]|nr:DUF5709 domain-containing protein [Pseudonocardiaceae bacterium]
MDRDSIDDEADWEQLEADDTLDYGGPADPLDEGYSPNEKPLGVDEFGTTAREAEEGESLDGRLAREVPEVTNDEDDDGLGDSSDTDGELVDDEVGGQRSGRLVSESYIADDEDGDEPAELFAADIGVDGAGASAEEAAVHIVDPDDE